MAVLLADASPGFMAILTISAVVVSIGIFVAFVLAFVRRQARLRSEGFMEALEDQLSGADLEFSQEDSLGRCERLQEFKVGSVGRRRKVSNVVSGVWEGREVLCCDYRYVVGHGKHQRAYSQTILIMNLVRPFPPFVMGPEGFFAKIAQVFGASDIDFQTHPEFSKSYVLKGKDEEGVRAAFSFDLLEYFEAQRGLTLESHDGLVLFYRVNKRCKPAALEAFFGEGFEVLDALAGKFPAASSSGPEGQL